jgi:hypothetical protein
MKNADRPINPIANGMTGLGGLNHAATGLTKREYAAINIMAGLAACDDIGGKVEMVASCAVTWADALLAELEKTA